MCAAGNSTPTIPHKFSKHRGSLVPMAPWDVQTLQLQMAGAAAICMRSAHVVVELWPWQATPGWSDCGGNCRQKIGRKDQARRSALNHGRRREDGA